MVRILSTSLVAALLLWHVLAVAEPASVFLEDMTTTELAGALRDGHTTIIIPVGGTEQNGPHMTLGKHNARVRILAGRVAQQLGNTVVAPVIAYVPQGQIEPPTEHMRFAGTISIPEPAFRAVLEGAARSLRRHGFRDVVLIGDHGGYQGALKAVASKLNAEWKASAARVHYVGAYYQITQTAYMESLKAGGLVDAQIGSHAGSADTSLQLAVAPATVRPGLFEQAARDGRAGGTVGDPRAASARLGQAGADSIVLQTVAEIRAAVSSLR